MSVIKRPSFTDYEITAMSVDPNVLAALADHHSVRETMAAAQDYMDSARYHEARRIELTRLAGYIELCHANDHDPEFGGQFMGRRLISDAVPGHNKLQVLGQWIQAGDLVQSQDGTRRGFILDAGLDIVSHGNIMVQWWDEEFKTWGQPGSLQSIYTLTYLLQIPLRHDQRAKLDVMYDALIECTEAVAVNSDL